MQLGVYIYIYLFIYIDPKVDNFEGLFFEIRTPSWMSQEVSKGSVSGL